ncbi:uncharacterized protein LOC143306623 [Osmia lignaria lignaria]|uniref:uncharacterized protein LOC143306623 n=1 Tax=Osmia lignaria lignaria TaxID=1437193 RepID=UPI00402B37AD
MPPFKLKYMRAKRSRKIGLRGNTFLVEELNIDSSNVESSSSSGASSTDLQSKELGLVPIRQLSQGIDTVMANSTSIPFNSTITDVPLSSTTVAAAVSKNTPTSIESSSILSESYLRLSLVKDLIPQFDGKSSSLTEFIKECQLISSKVKPEDRAGLLFLIRGKIVGHAKLILSNRREPNTLDELIGLLKKAYVRSFNMHSINEEFMGLKQGTNDSVEVFGSRVSKILSTGIEVAKDTYNSEQLSGVVDLLNNTAIATFINGLRNGMLRIMLKDKDSKEIPDLEAVIDIARRLESVTVEGSRLSPSSQPLIGNANVRKIDFDDRRCFQCNKVGHLRSHCPQIQETRRNPLRQEQIRCRYCKKTGHMEARCFRKQGQNSPQPQGVFPHKITDQGHLNSKGVPRRGVARNEPWIAPFKPVGPAPRSK